MKITLTSSFISEIVNGFRPLKLAKKATLDVLRCLRFAVTPGTMVVTATDLNEALTLTVPLASVEGTLFLVPYGLLAEVAKQCGSDLTFSCEQKDGKPAWSLTGFADGVKLVHPFTAPDVAEFPPDLVFEDPAQPAPAGFIRSVLEAFTAASKDETRYILNSVHISPTHVVGTNGRVLYASNSLAFTLPQGGLMLPSTDLLRVFMPDHAADLLVQAKDGVAKAAGIRQGPWLWATKVIEGQYPNWAQVVPKETDYGTAIRFAQDDAARVARVLPKLPGHSDKDSPVSLQVEDRVATLHAGNPGAAVKLDLPGAVINGPSVSAKFNREFLVSALNLGFRQLQVRDKCSPILMRDGPRLFLWMPLRPEAPAAPAAVSSAPDNNATAPAEASPTTPDQPTMNANTTQTTAGPAPAPVNRLAPATVPAPTTNRIAEAMASPAAAPASTPTSLEAALEQVQQAREGLRTLAVVLAQLVPTLKDAAREHKALDRDHEALKKNIRSLREINV